MSGRGERDWGSLLTELGHIGKTLDIRLLQDLELFGSQASLCVVLANGWCGVFSCELIWLVALLALLCREVVVWTKVEASARDGWSVLVGLFSQWAARRFVKDRIIVLARTRCV